MATEDRNFRSRFYGKVGCDSVEEKKSVKKLLEDPIRNHAKLKQFCLNYTVPTAERAPLWNIILGIYPLHKNSTNYFLEVRKNIYDDLYNAALVFEAVTPSHPEYKVIHAMWLIENNKLLHVGKGNLQDTEHFHEIVKVLLEIFDYNVPEVYWISKEFYSLTREIKEDTFNLKGITQTILKTQDTNVCTHLEELGVFKSDVIDYWYASCFASVISETAIIKIWDKICGGSRKIVIFLLLAIIKAHREKVLKCKSVTEFKIIIEEVKDSDAVIVNKAIKTWQIRKQNENKKT